CKNAGCTNEFETTYAPERPERVYCEECYQKEIY
ncbi:DNA-directed RNA polymerase, partial [Candidatus Falkowbacteria bacterium]|nr:DNA-directed RNA polymerase [Candidatus Falkowbacteria bacterium]